ncbi:MAG: type II CAAX endopeptidase family protein [Gemmatimonadota bacterium]
MNPLWTRRSVKWFFLVGFGVPWLGWTLRAVAGVSNSPIATALFYTGDFMTVGGFVATYVAAGRPGLISLFKRYFQVRASVPWILYALFLPFVWIGLATVTYGATHGGVGRIAPAGLLMYVSGPALIAMTTGPLGEEAGWRGFLLPRLLGRYSPIAASLILGVIWSAWHYPLYYNRVFASIGGAANFTISCLCFSVLLTVLWAFTRASVFWAIILHWSVNVTPGVVGAVFPDIPQPDGGVGQWLRVGFLVITTVAVIAMVGAGRLREKLAEARSTLDDEAIDADRRP